MDEFFMRRALNLAKKGGRAAAPNPMVGAVIVKNGKIIGQGYHQKFGGPHAEVNAIRSVKNPKDLQNSTLYVTLEPCRHWGKTPPCARAIARAGITRVIAGSRDPFQKQLIRLRRIKLKIKFVHGPLADECKKVNKFFFTWVTKKRPWVTAKIATSADGFVAASGGAPIHFTSIAQDRVVHALRARHQAIMVGINTVLNDDPRLTVRHVKGPDPLRVILDTKLRIPIDAKVLKDPNILIATCAPLTSKKARTLQNRGITLWRSPKKRAVSLPRLLRHLATRGISSVLAEPGPTLYRALKKARLIDELIVFTGNKLIRNGLKILQNV